MYITFLVIILSVWVNDGLLFLLLLQFFSLDLCLRFIIFHWCFVNEIFISIKWSLCLTGKKLPKCLVLVLPVLRKLNDFVFMYIVAMKFLFVKVRINQFLHGANQPSLDILSECKDFFTMSFPLTCKLVNNLSVLSTWRVRKGLFPEKRGCLFSETFAPCELY